MQSLIAPHAKSLLKYQPQNFALLIEERIVQDQVLNKNSDFYALYLLLKRSKTPMEIRDAIQKYKKVLSDPAHRELLKTILAILETLYRHLNPDEEAFDVRFASLEEAVTMLNTATTNWKENTIAKYLPDWKKDTVEAMMPTWKKDTVEAMMPTWEREFKEKRTCENNSDLLKQIAKKLKSMGLQED